jgi:hypothetical protein
MASMPTASVSGVSRIAAGIHWWSGALDPRVKCIVSTIPVVDGWVNMERVHGAIGFRRLREAIWRSSCPFRVRRARLPPDVEPNPATELVTWPFPEVTEVFLELQRTVAPAHEHRNTVASVELLMNYDVFPYAVAFSTRRR